VEALKEHEVPCEVLVLTNGEAAETFLDEIDAGRQCCPDLFILDLNLPRKARYGSSSENAGRQHLSACSRRGSNLIR
jgi:hypothetical protein